MTLGDDLGDFGLKVEEGLRGDFALGEETADREGSGCSSRDSSASSVTTLGMFSFALTTACAKSKAAATLTPETVEPFPASGGARTTVCRLALRSDALDTDATFSLFTKTFWSLVVVGEKVLLFVLFVFREGRSEEEWWAFDKSVSGARRSSGFFGWAGSLPVECGTSVDGLGPRHLPLEGGDSSESARDLVSLLFGAFSVVLETFSEATGVRDRYGLLSEFNFEVGETTGVKNAINSGSLFLQLEY